MVPVKDVDTTRHKSVDKVADSFAERILKRQGWKPGDGLGKQAQGISVPIKPSLKFDKTGIGHDPAKEFTDHWWDDAYKKAMDKITVNCEQDGTVNLDWKKDSSARKDNSRQRFINSRYTSFVQTATLDGGKLLKSSNEEATKGEDAQHGQHSKRILTDEELFAACGGLTAHKGARHGHKMSAKQKRVEMQEKELMVLMKKTYNIHKAANKCSSSTLNSDAISDKALGEQEKEQGEKESKKHKKSKRKKHKSKNAKSMERHEAVNSKMEKHAPENCAGSDDTDMKENSDKLRPTGKSKKKKKSKSHKIQDCVYDVLKIKENRREKMNSRKRKANTQNDKSLPSTTCDKGERGGE